MNRAFIEQKLSIPEYRALLDVIADPRYEGANYNTLFGGGTFSNYSRHPRQTVCSGGYCSTAAGRYQFLDFVWAEVSGQLGLSDFSPRSQDIAAIHRMFTIRRVTPEDIESGDPNRWMSKIHDEWTSIPGGSTVALRRQDKGTREQFIQRYNEYLAYHKGQGPAPSNRKAASYDNTAATPSIPGEGAHTGALMTGGIENIINALFDRFSAPEWPYTQQEAIVWTGTQAKSTSPLVGGGSSYGVTAPGFAFNESSTSPTFPFGDIPAADGRAVRPTTGPVTSNFGPRIHPITGRARPHEGIDIGAPTGTPVVAVLAGQVTFASTNGGYGKQVKIRHDSGHESSYAHLNSFSVQVGVRVAQGQEIGKVGSTGASTGPHLHFEWRFGGKPFDPRTTILRGLV
jgi:murein DD-endopeptidase MepM/ murein hydrolase activator NlpD